MEPGQADFAKFVQAIGTYWLSIRFIACW